MISKQSQPLAGRITDIAQRCWRATIKEWVADGRRLNSSALARVLGQRMQTAWGWSEGRTRWPATQWIEAMALLGCVDVFEDDDGQWLLKIEVPTDERAAERLLTLRQDQDDPVMMVANAAGDS
jgi:hypothetical protein